VRRSKLPKNISLLVALLCVCALGLVSCAKHHLKNATDDPSYLKNAAKVAEQRKELSPEELYTQWDQKYKTETEFETVPIKIGFEPPDRLFEIDLKAKLSHFKDLHVVEKSEPGVISIEINRLQYDLVQHPERTETIIYAQHEVNLAGAVLLMPRNASYLYDYTAGATQVNFAFEIKATLDNTPVAEKLFRDKIVIEYSFCRNERIQNVFGGVKRATFIANGDMAQRCGGSNTSASPDYLRDCVINQLTSEIRQLVHLKNGSAT